MTRRYRIKEFKTQLDKSLQLWKDDQIETLHRVAEILKTEFQRATPYRTGRARDSVYAKINVGQKRVSVGYDLQQAPHAVFFAGTRPHVITPRYKRALRFIARDGSEVFTMRVQHPGTKRIPVAEIAREESAGAVEAVLEQAGRDMIRNIIGP